MWYDDDWVGNGRAWESHYLEALDLRRADSKYFDIIYSGMLRRGFHVAAYVRPNSHLIQVARLWRLGVKGAFGLTMRGYRHAFLYGRWGVRISCEQVRYPWELGQSNEVAVDF